MTYSMDSATRSGKRRRLFKRDPDFRSERSRAGRMVPTERDLDMIAAIARHRFLNTDQVCRLFACDCPREFRENQKVRPARVSEHKPGCACSCGAGHLAKHDAGCRNLLKDDQHVASRLRELFNAGYLERPVNQLWLRIKNGEQTTGSVSLVYCPTAAGIALIGEARREAIGRGKLSWIGKPNEGGRIFMEHATEVANISIGVDLGVRAKGELVRMSETELRAGMTPERQASERPWSLAVQHEGKTLPVECDLAFGIDDPTARKRYRYLIECDLGHMPIERKDLTRTSIMRKLIAYEKAMRLEMYKTEFGWPNLRVVILTTSQERAKSCLKAARAHFGSSRTARMFLFGTLKASRDLLGYKFADIDGNRPTLLETSPAKPS